MTLHKINKKYKDRLFRLIFQDKKDLLELYNAINNSDYTNPEDLTITTIEDVVYMGMKNDLSFLIDDVLNLYEHQSSFSPNLPLRGLFYFSSLYREQIEPVKQRLYTNSPLYIPFPQYLVFYNGTKEEPERQELKLSDLFITNGKGATPALECTALVLNINLGHNRRLMEKCKALKEYAQFIAIIRENIAVGMIFEDAVENAVDVCIKKGILSEILRKNRAEVIEMILTEYDENEFRDFLKEEAWNEGHKAGMEDGIKRGIQRGMRTGLLEGTIKTCMDFQISKEQTIAKLRKDFSMSEEEAEQSVEKYWK